MVNTSSDSRKSYNDILSGLSDYTDQMLLDDVWERPGLTPRERCIMTIGSLIALQRTDELRFHIRQAFVTGLTQAEIIEITTHLAFYAGWRKASAALTIVLSIFDEKED